MTTEVLLCGSSGSTPDGCILSHTYSKAFAACVSQYRAYLFINCQKFGKGHQISIPNLAPPVRFLLSYLFQGNCAIIDGYYLCFVCGSSSVRWKWKLL